MNARLPVLIALAAATAPVTAVAQEPAAPDTSGWACKFCVADTGASGWVEPRLGDVSADSFRFGDFTGLEQRGVFADLDAAWRWRDTDTARGWDLRAASVGLDARALEARGGRQGAWRVTAGYESLPRLRADDARTPFGGGATLALPAAWVRAGSTGGMTVLDASLHGIALRQERERVALGVALGVALTPRPPLDFALSYRRDEIRGTGSMGGSFLTLAAELPRRLDQTHDRIDASAAWRSEVAHAQLALASSFFSNGVAALGWQNPYTSPADGADAGQLAQAPDNRAWQLSLATGSGPALPVQLSGRLVLGRMLQDQRFLPATLNPDEAVALPRDSLGARVDTLQATARVSLPLGHALRLSADVLRDDRDNRTPSAAYPQVVMDSFTGATRVNAPFGFTRNRWRFSAERRAAPRFAVGVEDDRRRRRLYGRADTTERRWWARAGWQPLGADLRVKVARAHREGSEFAPAAGAAPQNPLLRTTNTAARRRDEARADLGFAWPRLAAAFNATWADEEFPDTRIGRTSGNDLGYGADLQVRLGESVALGLFAAHRRQEADQAGSQAFGVPDWSAQTEDTTNVAGINATWQAPRGLELGVDYVVAASEGTIAVLASDRAGFPVLMTRWHDARAFARYPLRPDLTLRLDVLREVYEASDWALAGVAPDTVPNLLALGRGAGDGSVTAAVLSARWRF